MLIASEDQVNLTLRPFFKDMVDLVLGAHVEWTTSYNKLFVELFRCAADAPERQCVTRLERWPRRSSEA